MIVGGNCFYLRAVEEPWINDGQTSPERERSGGGERLEEVVGQMDADYLLLLYKVVLTQATLQRYLLRAGWQQARAAEQSNTPKKRIGTRTREREIARARARARVVRASRCRLVALALVPRYVIFDLQGRLD
jgi:hypothetical protein